MLYLINGLIKHILGIVEYLLLDPRWKIFFSFFQKFGNLRLYFSRVGTRQLYNLE
ncbi:hypothetical protein D3C81_696810 [compost metagenome]